MTQHDPRPPIASTLALLTGNAILFGSLLLTLVFPQLHLGLAVAFGAMLGTPFFVLGFRLQSQSNPGDGTSKPFLPTRTEARRVFRGLVACAIFLACFYGPLALVVLTGYFLPAGDNWRVVTIRLSFVVLAACSWYSWVRFISKTTPNWFRGRLPDKTLHTLTCDAPTEQPESAVAAALNYWHLPVIAIVAFCIAIGVIDFDSPLLRIDAGPKRARGLMLLIQWCRGNPNTVTSSAVLVGTVAAAWYVFRIRCAAATRNTDAQDSRHTTLR